MPSLNKTIQMLSALLATSAVFSNMQLASLCIKATRWKQKSDTLTAMQQLSELAGLAQVQVITVPAVHVQLSCNQNAPGEFSTTPS